MFKLRQLLIEIFKTFNLVRLRVSIIFYSCCCQALEDRLYTACADLRWGGGGVRGLNPPEKFNSSIKFTENRPRIPPGMHNYPSDPPFGLAHVRYA